MLHGALMFFVAPRVMSHTGSADMEARRAHRPPMSVRRFEGDPFRERTRTEPAADVAAPREAPKVGRVGTEAAPSAISVSEIPASVPAVAMPEVISGPVDAPAELPRPSIPDAAAVRDTGFTVSPDAFPRAPTVPAAALAVPVAAPVEMDSFIPAPGILSLIHI